MISLYVFLTLIIPQVAIIISFLIIPAISRDNLYFGISIPSDKKNESQLVQIRHWFSKAVLISGFIISLIMLVPYLLGMETNYYIILYMIFIFLELFVFMMIFLRCRSQVMQYKKSSDFKDMDSHLVTIDTDFRIKNYQLSIGWFLTYPLIIVGTILLSLSQYDKLPQRIPIHFDSSGAVNGWADKSYGTIMLFPAIQLIIALLFVGIFLVIRKAKQQINTDNPNRSLLQNKIFRYIWSIYVFASGILILLLFFLIQLSILQIVKGMLITWLTLPIPLIMVVSAIILSIKTGQSGNRIKVKTTIENKPNGNYNRNDDQFWKMGVIYYNPKDPSIFIEKRVGIGWTINWGRPIAWIIASILVIIIILSILLPFILLP